MWHISGCSPSQQTIENEGFGRDPPTNDLDGHPGCRCCTDGKTSPTHILALPSRELAAYGPTPTKWQKQTPSSGIPFRKLCRKTPGCLFLGILIHGLLLMLPRNHWGSRDLFPRSFFTQPGDLINQRCWLHYCCWLPWWPWPLRFLVQPGVVRLPLRVEATRVVKSEKKHKNHRIQFIRTTF